VNIYLEKNLKYQKFQAKYKTKVLVLKIILTMYFDASMYTYSDFNETAPAMINIFEYSPDNSYLNTNYSHETLFTISENLTTLKSIFDPSKFLRNKYKSILSKCE